MSAAAADPAIDLPAKGGKKKLILIVAVVLVLLLGGGGAYWFKSKAAAAHAAEDTGEDAAAAAPEKSEKGEAHPPTFLPLDPFVVNLADKDADRYAQVGITLEVDSAVVAEEMKAYMPAIRNTVLLILASKTAHDLLDRAGKEQLADEIMREAVRPMGIDMPVPRKAKAKPKAADGEPAAGTEGSAAADDAEEAPPPRKAKRAPHNPIRAVNFSNFIIQ